MSKYNAKLIKLTLDDPLGRIGRPRKCIWWLKRCIQSVSHYIHHSLLFFWLARIFGSSPDLVYLIVSGTHPPIFVRQVHHNCWSCAHCNPLCQCLGGHLRRSHIGPVHLGCPGSLLVCTQCIHFAVLLWRPVATPFYLSSIHLCCTVFLLPSVHV